MSFPPLSGGDHSILSSEYCSGYTDVAGVWNTGFYCPQTGSTLAVYCCGTPSYKYCCTDKPPNGTGSGIVEDHTLSSAGASGNGSGAINIDGGERDGNDYSGATRIRPPDNINQDSISDLSSLNLSDVPIIFGVACGVAAVLIIVILAGFYLTSCCAHYHQVHQNRKRRSSMPGIYRGGGAAANTSTNSGLVNLYSPTNSAGAGAAGGLENTQTYIVHHQHPPPASPDSISTSVDHYQMGGGGSSSLVTTPLDIEWSSASHQYLQQKPIQQQQPQQQFHNPSTSSSTPQLILQQPQQHPLNILGSGTGLGNHIEGRIHYSVHQTQNRLAVALTGSMNRLSDRPSPCPTPSSSYHVNIPLTPPDGFSYPRQAYSLSAGGSRGLSPPPQYSSAVLARAESPPYYPSYDSGSSSNTTDNQFHQHNYLSRTSTLPISLTRKPPTGLNRPMLTSPGPYGTGNSTAFSTPQQPKSILRTSQNYRRVVTNETPPPIPSHIPQAGAFYAGPSYSLDSTDSGSIGTVSYRNVDSRTNLSSQPLLLLESGKVSAEVDEENEEEPQGVGSRRASISTAVNTTVTAAEPEDEAELDERRDQFDIHDIDSDALSRLIEMDLDSKL